MIYRKRMQQSGDLFMYLAKVESRKFPSHFSPKTLISILLAISLPLNSIEKNLFSNPFAAFIVCFS